MKRISKLSLVLLASLPLIPQAAPALAETAPATSPWYAAVTGSAISLPTQKGRNVTQNLDTETASERGYGARLALGYTFGSNIRAEVEAGFARIDPKRVTLPSIPVTLDLAGKQERYTGMLNIFYDFHNSSPLTPYIGVGAGESLIRMTSETPSLHTGEIADDRDIAFTYQASAGVSFDVTPTTTVVTGYRYTGQSDAHFTSHTGDTIINKFKSHEAMLGLRVRF